MCVRYDPPPHYVVDFRRRQNFRRLVVNAIVIDVLELSDPSSIFIIVSF